MSKLNEQLEIILKGTNSLSFPFFSSEKRKQEIIQIKKSEIDKEISLLLGGESAANQRYMQFKDKCWNNAVESAKKQFESLPKGLKINSFYLQEVMHRYVEEIISELEKAHEEATNG